MKAIKCQIPYRTDMEDVSILLQSPQKVGHLWGRILLSSMLTTIIYLPLRPISINGTGLRGLQ